MRPVVALSRIWRWTVLAACLPVTLQLSGCTAIGFTVGAGLDILNNDKTPGRFHNLNPGSGVTLTLKDREQLHGEYIGNGAFSEANRSPAGSVGVATPNAQLMVLGNEQRRPLTTVRIAVGPKVREVPLSDIARVDAPAPRGHKIFLSLVGFAMDAWVVWKLSTTEL